MTEIATFGAGCFWGVQDYFDKVPGVTETIVGYEGGTEPNPTYELICSHTTKYVEVTEVHYDPEKVTFEALVRHFFKMHDPTQVNAQGPDVGWQYRSVIFTHSDEQAQIAQKVIDELTEARKFAPKRIATIVEPAQPFYRAEEYHQHYAKKTGRGACHVSFDEVN